MNAGQGLFRLLPWGIAIGMAPWSVRWAGLGPRLGWWMTWASIALALAMMSSEGIGHLRRLRAARTRLWSGKELQRWVQHHPRQLLLGFGFDWKSRHSQRLHERLTGGGAASPDSNDILALEGRPRAVTLASHQGLGHTLAVGAPGTGKTQLFKLLTVQAIARGDAVIVLDPKGGDSLRSSLEAAATRANRPFFRLLPSRPEDSDRLNPLAHGRQASELASRISRLMPADESDNAFGQFAWTTLNRIIEGVLALGEAPSLTGLRFHVSDQGKTLLVRLRAAGIASPASAWEGVATLAAHEPTHYGKMILALTPILESLTAGALGVLLSPQLPGSGPAARPLLNLAQIVGQAGVLYVGLDSLSDAALSRALGAMLLADLAAVAGDRYRGAGDRIPVQIFVDEAAEVSNPAFIQLLNKGRECGFTVTFAVQTLADLEVAMGGAAPARMMVGNAANLIAFRTLDPESQRLWSERAGSCWIRSATALVSAQRAESAEGWRRGIGAALNQQDLEVPRMPEAMLGRLPNLRFVGLLGSGRMVVGQLPVVTG